MNLVALASTILSLYTAISAYPKNTAELNVLQRAALAETESDIVKCVEHEMGINVDVQFKEKLMSQLSSHSADIDFNRKYLGQFLKEKLIDDMVDTAFKIYEPVADIAVIYDSLDYVNKTRVKEAENKILSNMKNRHHISLDSVNVGDFRALIRAHGKKREINRLLLKQFFTYAECGAFNRIAHFLGTSKKGDEITRLRRKLQGNPDLFSAHSPRPLIPIQHRIFRNGVGMYLKRISGNSVEMHPQQGLRGGKKT